MSFYNGTPEINPAYLKMQRDKREISMAAIAIGIVCCCVFGITKFWLDIYFIIASFFGVMPQKALQNINSDPVFLEILQIVISSLTFTVPFIITAKIRNMRISDLIPFNKAKKGTKTSALLLGLGFCAFADVAVNFSSAIFEGFGINYSVPQNESPKGIFGFLLVMLSTAVVPALVEEFACRGVILGFLKPFGNTFAVITSAAVFGILHGNFEQMPFAFTVGLILGFIRIETGSMNICILVHFINNAVSVGLNYLGNYISVGAQNTVYIIFLAVCLLLGIAGIILLPKREKAEEKETEEKPYSEAKKYLWFFTNPAIIAFVVLNVLLSFQFFG